MEPHPFLVEWIEENQHTGRALVGGSGLGEDAAFLDEKGWEVTAFDVSQQLNGQVNCTKERRWLIGDLVRPEENWKRAWTLSSRYILQAIPEKVKMPPTGIFLLFSVGL